MKNKLKLGQAAGVVAFAILIGAVSVNAGSTNGAVHAKAAGKNINTLNAGVALNVSEMSDEAFSLTAGVTAELAYVYSDISIADNDNDVVTASADEAESTEAAEPAQTAAQLCGYTNLAMSVISSGNLNIRSEASTDSDVVGILTNHNACEVLEDAGDWLKVTSGKVTGYVNKEYLVTGDEANAIAEQEVQDVATVNTETLKVRSEKSTESSVLSLVGDSEAFTVNSVADGWVEINVDDSVGYVSQDYVTLSKSLPTAKTVEQVKYGDSVSDVRVSAVSYALQFVGNRYVWGGTSLTNGVDCSGFTMQIMAKYGISLPHSSKAQPSYGTKISSSEAQPGDLFFYGSGHSISHVAMYIGNGQIVHASNKRDGIKISNAYYRTPICVVRYF